MESKGPPPTLPLQDHNKNQQAGQEGAPSLPYINYSGKVQYCTTLIDCAIVCDDLLTKVQESSDILVIGFDLEWPFTYRTGSGKTALIQMSPSLEECFLLQVSEIRNLPKSLTELLAHPNVRLTGVFIRNDVLKLARDFRGVDKEKVLSNCIDVGIYANKVFGTHERWSMARLVIRCFKLQINKNKNVRMSKWNVMPLSEEQIKYAATDAYVSLKLYLHLNEFEQRK